MKKKIMNRARVHGLGKLDRLHHQLFHHASKMSCAAEDIKRKVVSADLFQTPKRQEVPVFGAFNSFFVLHRRSRLRDIAQDSLQPIESETEMIVTKNCTQFNLPARPSTAARWRRWGNGRRRSFRRGRTLVLEQGKDERIDMSRLNEALDIAPRAAVSLETILSEQFWARGKWGILGVIKGYLPS